MPPRFARISLQLAALVLGLGVGCVTTGGAGARHAYAYFGTPSAHDAWSAKISEWQARARRGAGLAPGSGPASVSGPGTRAGATPSAALLRAKYDAFRRERRRALAHDVADWIQAEARTHYVPDGDVDYWATLEETLSRGAEDCDGLELVAHEMLLELGFAEEEVYRAIVFRPSDGQHHMVTFWFEDAHDPWVVDPTGAMTTGMPRMSELPEWVPIKVFDPDREYTVRGQRARR